MSERWLHIRRDPRPVRGYYFAVNPFDSPPSATLGGSRRGSRGRVGRRTLEGVSTRRAGYRAKKWPTAGKARGELDVDETPGAGIHPRESRSPVVSASSRRSPRRVLPAPRTGTARAVFGAGRRDAGRVEGRFCDPGAAVVINILFAIGRNRSPFLSRLSPCKCGR